MHTYAAHLLRSISKLEIVTIDIRSIDRFKNLKNTYFMKHKTRMSRNV